MKKVIIIGPVLSRSGYGEMARNAIKSLNFRKDLFDVYVQPTSWGGNANIINKNNPDFNLVNELIKKTNQIAALSNNQIMVDISIQVSLPTDWKKLAPINIGYTAGIETNYISPRWLEPSMQMDKIIVISEHAKKSFDDTIFSDGSGKQFKVSVPIEVVHFPIKNHAKTDLEIDFDYDFNFLSVCQWGPRKNLEQTIINFLEEFKDEEVGLVLKVNTINDSIIDKDVCERKIKSILDNFKNRKCKVYLVHGYMREEELNSLYQHPKIKAIVSTTHGEGFGLPLFEATYNELPVIATDWSGHLDFLKVPDEQNKEKKLFAKIDFELKPISKEHVWQGVLEEGTSWAFPKPSSVRDRMREVFKDYSRFKSWAKKLASYNKEKFTEEKVYNSFINVFKPDEKTENWMKEINETDFFE